MPDINGDDVIEEVRREFPSFEGWVPSPGTTALTGTVEVDGKPRLVYLNRKEIGPRSANEGLVAFMISEIRRQVGDGAR